MSEELKPCPFCGGEAEYSKVEKWQSIPYGHEYHFVTCKNHCLEGLYARGNTKEEAIGAWNNRPSPWHTGTPTEEGAYLVQYENNYTERIIFKNGSFIAKNDITHGDGVVHGSDKYENVTDIVIAWQKIEPYKERTE